MSVKVKATVEFVTHSETGARFAVQDLQTRMQSNALLGDYAITEVIFDGQPTEWRP